MANAFVVFFRATSCPSGSTSVGERRRGGHPKLLPRAGNRGPDIRFCFALCQVQRRYPLLTLSCTASGTPEVRQNSGFSAMVTHYKAASIGWFGFTPFLRVACVLARVRATA